MRHTALMVVLLLGGCDGSLLGPEGTPADANAVIRPASMVADREIVAPGDLISLDFPDEEFVGIGYALEQEVGSSWVHRYLLIAPEGAGDPGWYVAKDDVEVPDIGIADPVRVSIPEGAEPGTWRICTIGGAENLCVRIEIVRP